MRVSNAVVSVASSIHTLCPNQKIRQGGAKTPLTEILALVLHHDEKVVLMAVTMALESGVPTKTHIRNLLQGKRGRNGDTMMLRSSLHKWRCAATLI